MSDITMVAALHYIDLGIMVLAIVIGVICMYLVVTIKKGKPESCDRCLYRYEGLGMNCKCTETGRDIEEHNWRGTKPNDCNYYMGG